MIREVTDSSSIADLCRNLEAPARATRPIRVSEPEVHPFAASDGVELRLLRFPGGSKGPVVLSHCIGVSSLMYALDTIETNLLEYLYEHGFDVWLLDHRLSVALPASQQPSTLDDVATKDYPATVAKVRELTGAESIQIVAHGVGSSTLTMAILSGLAGVRSAVCSQVSTHLQVSFLNLAKTSLFMASVLSVIGVRSLTAFGADQSWRDRLYDKSLRLYPIQREERCQSSVCRRITSMYGALYEHDQLNDETHAALRDMFGVVNIQAFRQLGRITRTGHVVTADGSNSYLPHVDRMTVPTAFIHGEENDCVLPESTAQTHELLKEHHGDIHRRHVIPGYGHVDCMFGKNASADVYPLVLQHLEETA